MRKQIRRLRSLLRRHGRSREDADDLIQEAFLRLHVYCRSGKVQQEEAFLRRAVLNLSVDLHRKEHRERFTDVPVESLKLPDIRPAPDEELDARQRLDGVVAVLDSLPARTREIFVMHRVEGYGCAEIGRHLGISVSAVEKHIARAVLALMDVVERR